MPDHPPSVEGSEQILPPWLLSDPALYFYAVELLVLAGDTQSHSLLEALSHLPTTLPQEYPDRPDLIAEIDSESFSDRVKEARTFLKRIGLIEYPRRSHFQITAQGCELLDYQARTPVARALTRVLRTRVTQLETAKPKRGEDNKDPYSRWK